MFFVGRLLNRVKPSQMDTPEAVEKLMSAKYKYLVGLQKVKFKYNDALQKVKNM